MENALLPYEDAALGSHYKSLIRGRGVLMRAVVVASAICLSIVGSPLRTTRGPPSECRRYSGQGLGPALKAFCAARDLQVLYFSQTVRDMRTAGASGELDADETLRNS